MTGNRFTGGLACIILLCGFTSATIIDVVKYTFDNDNKDSSIIPTGISASLFDSQLKQNPAFVDGHPGKAFEDTGWASGTNFYYFSLTVTQGYMLSLDSLKFDNRKEPSTVGGWEVTYSVGGSPFTSAGTGLVDQQNVWLAASNGLSGIAALQNAAGTIYFRIKGTNGSNDKKKWDIDNVILTGDVQVVPEPATISMLILGMSYLSLRRKSL